MCEAYNEWAIALTKHFFGPHMSGKRTRLTVNSQFLNEEFGFLGGVEGFLAAVKAGPEWSYPCLDPGIHDKALRTHSMWKWSPELRPSGYPTLPDDAPPYIPFLVLLCLAWTVDDDDEHLSGNSFYNRLELIFPQHGLDSPQLSKWKKLWEGLEEWTGGLAGKRGIWKLERVGQVHVGIPCSQAILTPCKLRRLPWLFHVTGLSLLASRSTPKNQQVKAHMLQQESYTRSVLGNFLFKEITQDSEIGKGVIELLREELENPENRIYEEQESSERTPERDGSSRTKELPLRVALERSSTDNKWHLRYCLLGENAPSDAHNQQGLSFTKKGPSSYGPLWLAIENGELSRVNEINLQPEQTFQINFEAEDEDGAETIRLTSRKRSIRIFRNWVCQNYLFEEYNLPDSGGCYLLTHRDQRVFLTDWISKFEASGGRTVTVPQDGLPDNVQLTYIEGLDECDKDILSQFPEKTALTSKPSYLSFCGGSRIQIGSERLYLSYDLPSIMLESQGEVSLNVDGARLVEIASEGKAENKMPGSHLHEYEMEVESETPSVTFEVFHNQNEKILETRTIGVTDHQLDNFTRDISESIRFNRFGQAIDQAGIFGCIVDPEAKAQQEAISTGTEGKSKFVDIDESSLRWKDTDPDEANDKRWNLLESLSIKRRVTGKEFRRRAEKITGEWHAYSWSDLRWLRALCHIEVQRDKKGRIAYIYPVKPSSYKLPWLKGDLSYFCIAGCPTHRELDQLKTNAADLECRIRFIDRESSMLPDSIVVEGEESLARLCLEESGFVCPDHQVDGFDAETVAAWAGSLEERSKHFFWQPGYVQEPESVFNPYCFRMLAPEKFACPYKLYTIPDSHSPHNKWHAMMKSPGINDIDDEVRHVFLTDTSWGKWLTLGRASSGIPDSIDCPDEEHTPIPYDDGRCELIVPASLRFPSILTKALLMCSGLPPRTLRPYSLFSNLGSCLLPDKQLPYSGTCYAYRHVPLHIARLICSKVNAWPIPVSEI